MGVIHRRRLYILDRKSNSSLDLPCAFALTSSIYSFFYVYIVVPVCLITKYTSTSCSGVHSSLEYRAGCRARPLELYKKSPEKEKSRVGESDERINFVFLPAGQSSSVVLARDTYIGVSYQTTAPVLSVVVLIRRDEHLEPRVTKLIYCDVLISYQMIITGDSYGRGGRTRGTRRSPTAFFHFSVPKLRRTWPRV